MIWPKYMFLSSSYFCCFLSWKLAQREKLLFASFCAHKSKLFLTQKSCSLPHSLPSSAAAAEKAEEKEVLFLFMISHFSFEKKLTLFLVRLHMYSSKIHYLVYVVVPYYFEWSDEVRAKREPSSRNEYIKWPSGVLLLITTCNSCTYTIMSRVSF